MAPATPGMMRGIIGTDTPGITLLDVRENANKEKENESGKEEKGSGKENRDNGVKRKRLIETPRA